MVPWVPLGMVLEHITSCDHSTKFNQLKLKEEKYVHKLEKSSDKLYYKTKIKSRTKIHKLHKFQISIPKQKLISSSFP